MTSPESPDLSALPPALARLGSTLGLASGFNLSFVTGPRDHADSVYLRLFRALGRDFEVVRLPLSDTSGSGPCERVRRGLATSNGRPRVVFASCVVPGVVPSGALRALNLERDTLAALPASLVVWLPAWGLPVVRRVAPDLFDWRSALVTLHDDDLPVRDATEYLVWLCERHGGADRYVTGLPRVPRVSRVVYPGLDAAERDAWLRDLTLDLARGALGQRLRESGDADRHTLDVLSWEAKGAGSVVPLRLRGVDLAGMLGPPPDWTLLARAAGVPGAARAGELFDALARRGELVVILDGVDLLDLGPGRPAGELLAWLDGQVPPLRMIAALAGDASSRFARWLPSAPDARSLDEDFAGPAAELGDLLAALFPEPAELHVLAIDLLGPETAARFGLYGPASRAARNLADALIRRALDDAAFFAELRRMRPLQVALIDAFEQEHRADR